MGRLSDQETMKQLAELHSTLEIKLSIWLRAPSKSIMAELEQAAVAHADFLGTVMGLYANPLQKSWRSTGRPRKVDDSAQT